MKEPDQIGRFSAYNNLDLETILIGTNSDGTLRAGEYNFEKAEFGISTSKKFAFFGSCINLLARSAAESEKLTTCLMNEVFNTCVLRLDMDGLEAGVFAHSSLTYGVINLSWFLYNDIKKDLDDKTVLTFEHILGTNEPGLLKMIANYSKTY